MGIYKSDFCPVLGPFVLYMKRKAKANKIHKMGINFKK